MAAALRVVGIGGTLRSRSFTLTAVATALDGARQAGAEITLLDLRELELPLYDRDRETVEDPSVRRLITEVRHCDGLILGSPVYQESCSGLVKNALDHLNRLVGDRPPLLGARAVGLVSVGGNEMSTGAVITLRTVCRALGAWVLPGYAVIGTPSFEAGGGLFDLMARDRLLLLGRQLVQSVGARRSQEESVTDAASLLASL